MFPEDYEILRNFYDLEMAEEDTIPTIDISAFFKEDDEDGKSMALPEIGEACSQYGFFQVINHGVPVDLMRRALVLSKEFFSYSDEEK